MRARKSAARFNMKYWGASCKDISPCEMLAACGTQACLAGETVLEAGLGTIDKRRGGIKLRVGEYREIIHVASDWLGLNARQTANLFNFKAWTQHEGWPAAFEAAYNTAKTPRDRVQVAIDRVRHFIATEE
jgi:hypothetical protein